MEEVQREAKACKSCTPFTKLDIPNIWKKKIKLQQTIGLQQNKASKIYFTRHVQKKINNVEYYVTSYKGIEQR